MNTVNKLITKEDPYFIHKACGIYCIFNYFIQFYFYFMYNTIYLNYIILIPHILLHVTSFIFHVLSKRPTQVKGNMFIWEELRIHSLLFALRPCLGIIFPDYSYFFSYLTLILADVTTYYHGTNGISTVRGNHENINKRSMYKELIGSFFSVSQIGASIICFGIFQNKINPILLFATLPPIQTSAFGMTLIRKNIINKEIWSVVYSLELLLVYIIWYFEYNNINILFYSLMLYFIRRNGISKYIIWSLSPIIYNILIMYLNINKRLI
jgi:hypothetical protein